MQTGSLDAAVTSSTSLISFRLEEISKALTSGRGESLHGEPPELDAER